MLPMPDSLQTKSPFPPEEGEGEGKRQMTIHPELYIIDGIDLREDFTGRGDL